jgi:hypothetical protein
MNSSSQSNLFPAETVIVAYKGELIGGTAGMPQCKVEALVNEKRYFRTQGLSAKITVTNLIIMEFEALDPSRGEKPFNLYADFYEEFGKGPGELCFVPLDPEGLSRSFPLALLKNRNAVKEDSCRVHWEFEILPGDDGVFMTKLKTKNQAGNCITS